MSEADPYHAVEQEIHTTLHNATQLLESFLRIRSMAQREDSEELVWAASELKATLTTLETDLEDLDASVKIVESTDAKMFGLNASEVLRRRNYVNQVQRQIENMRRDVSITKPQPSGSRTPTYPLSPQPVRAPGYPSAFPDATEDEDTQAVWAREEQQMMIQEQDRTMDSISGTLTTIARQAGLIGQEIEVHNEMLGDIERGVDETDNKLGASLLKMRKFVRQTEEKGGGWCIVFLIIVLCCLLVAVILV